jgi:hypothetical protein
VAPEHRRERVALRDGEPLEEIEHWCAELVQAAVAELHLGLRSDRPRDPPAVETVRQEGKQRALAEPCLPAHDEDPTPTGESIGQELVERLALIATSEELCGVTAIVARRGLPAPSDDGCWQVVAGVYICHKACELLVCGPPDGSGSSARAATARRRDADDGDAGGVVVPGQTTCT